MSSSNKNLRLWCCLALVPIILSLLIAGYGRYKYNEFHSTDAPDGTEDWEPNTLEEGRIARREVLNVEENLMQLNLDSADEGSNQFLTPEYLEAEAEIAEILQARQTGSLPDEMIDEGPMASDEMLEMDEEGNPVIYDVSEGEWLASIALKLYGHKVYWGYLYEVNRDLLKSPDDLKAGMQLYLPNREYFGIDTTSTQSIQQAALRAANLLNEQQ